MTADLLLVRSAQHTCALPLDKVAETMRPLVLESMPEAPRAVRGVAVIRGRPVPVVDLRVLLGDDDGRKPKRLVTINVATERCVGLLVDEVLGVRTRAEVSPHALPPLLAADVNELVEELATLDAQLVMVLRAASLVPDEVVERVHGGAVGRR